MPRGPNIYVRLPEMRFLLPIYSLDIRKWESIVEAVEKWTPGGDAPFPAPESEDALTELKRHTSTTRFQVNTFSLS